MTTVTVRGGFDTFAGSINPSREHGDDRYLIVQSGTDTQYAFVYLKNPAPRGATIVSAKLRVRARGAWSGSQTLKVRRIAESWKASKLNWSNQPGVTGPNQPTATVGAVADGTVIEFDVTVNLQTVVNGSPHYGWRIETDGPQRKLYGFDAGDHKPVLEVTYSDKPGAPTNLSPAGGAVSVAKPVVQFDYADVNDDDLVAIRVQIDPAANGSSPAFDSGTVETNVPELDLSATTYAGLADGATTKWRAQVKDSGGLWSAWSDWESFSRDNKGTLTIDNPTAGGLVNEPTPPILWTLAGETQASWQVRITRGDDRSVVLYDSGKRKGSASSHTLPKRGDNGRRLLVDDRDYQVNVRVWDTKDRVATPGDPAFAFAWHTFHMDDDATVPAATGLTATQEGETPWVALEWTRATAPDSFVILRQGPDDDKPRVIESNLDPADILSGGVYRWRDWQARPRQEHTYYIKAVVNGRQSPRSAGASVTTIPTGVWIVDFDRDLSFVLSGLDVEGWRHTDQGAVHQPLGSPYSVRIIQGLNGMAGSFTGTLMAGDSRSLRSFENHLWKIKERPAETVQLIADDMSIPVKLHDLSCGPHPDTLPEQPWKLVSFQFRQVGDLPFEARV